MFGYLLLLFLSVPLIELMLFLTIGDAIGIWPTVAIVILTAVLGAALTRAQGLRTLRRYQQALAEGRLPHAEVIDGLTILVAGALLLTPGFLTDTIGFLLLAPPFRALVRGRLVRSLRSRVQFVGETMTRDGVERSSPPEPGGVIEVEAEIVED